MKKNILILVFLLGVSKLAGFNPATHMYLGMRDGAISFWEAFGDTSFANALRGYMYGENALLIKKFYLIGLTIPDMFDTDAQNKIRSFINSLYNHRNHATGPMYIQDHTHNAVQTPITFNGNPPNTNLEKLREMAIYARDHHWTSLEKALIYGAYMHVIQDLFAHMVLQPSRFGYGYAVESDSAFNLGGNTEDILFYAESFYELFTPTFIPDWSHIRNILYRGSMFSGSVFINYVWGAMEFYYRVSINGRIMGRWQDMNFLPVQKFVEAAQHVGYGNSSLTQERLESYLHGWAMMLFLTMGYRRNGTDLGGIFSHPQWSFNDIANFWVDIGDNYWRLCDTPVICDLIQTIAWPALRAALLSVVHSVFDYCLGDNPWYTYFETPENFDELWSCIPSSDRPEEYYDLRREIEFFYIYGTIDKPCMRASYSGEILRAIELFPIMRDVFVNGPQSLDYRLNGRPIWSLARKAGLLGGMWNIPNDRFVDQPGVINLFFADSNSEIYLPESIEVEGDPKILNLNYDIVTFGNTKINIRSVKTPIPITSVQFTDIARHDGTLLFNAQEIVSNGSDTVFFEVRTGNRDNPNQFATMFSSDYRGVYNSQSAVYSNPYYQHYFVNGNPVRSEDQNPVEHPDLYWPYILPLNPVLTALNEPSNFNVSTSNNYRNVTLTWTDRSRYNSGYEIQRIDEEGNVRTITINDSDATSYVDHTVAPFHTYDYKIRAINNDDVASEWVTERVYNTPTFLVQNASKVMHKGNKEYIAIAQSVSGSKWHGMIILLKSSMDGINWTTEDTIYRLISDFVIRSFKFDMIPVDLQNGVKFAGLAIYELGNNISHVDFITYSGVGLHGVIEVFSGNGVAGHPTLIWNRESNNVGINFVFTVHNSLEERIYWAEYTLSNTISILGYIDAHNLFNTTSVASLSPLKVDGVEVAEFPWGVVLNSSNYPSGSKIIAFYGDDEYSYVVLDTIQAYGGFVDSDNNRVVWASEEGIKEAVIDGVADMIWVDRTEMITQDITGENVFSLDYSQNSYGDEVIGVVVRDTESFSKFITYTRPAGNTQWSSRIIERHAYNNGQVAFSNRYRGRAGIYQKYLALYDLNASEMAFKERSFKVKDEIVIRPDIMKGDLSSIHHGDSNYIFFSRYGYVNYVQSDNTVTGWSRENIICKGYNPVAVHTDSSFTVFYVRNDSLFARTHSDGFENEHFVVKMGQFSPGYGVSYSDGNYYIVYEEMAGQMAGDTLFTPQSWSLKTAVVSSDFSVIREETLDHTEDGLPTGVNPYRSQGRRVSIGSFNGYRYVLAVKPGSGVKLYRNDSGAWESRSVNIGNGPYGNLNIKVDDKTVYLTWSDGGTVYYRFLYAGDPGFISKAIELSSGDNPNYGGKAIFWSDGNKLEKMSLALEDEPAELMTAGTGDISNTALTFYTVGGEYYQTSVYLSALMIKDGSSNMLGVNVYSTGPIPEQVITLGDTIPTPKTIERSGFEEYSDEKGKSADVGDRLSYRITDLNPNEYYRLGLYIYHEEEDDITEQFYLDGKPVKSELIQKGKETYIELEVPEEMYVEDSTVVLEVEKESGPVAVLNEIYVFGKPIAGSGPMSEEEVMLIPETYRVMSISPNPMRGRGEIVLGIPEDGKVRVDVYNIEGRRVKELFNGMVRKGYYRVRVEGLESGMYFVVVRGEHGKAMKKMMVLR